MSNQLSGQITLQQNRKRIVALDAVKALAFVCVICLHTLRHIDSTVPYHSVLYYFARIAIPLFFMVTGYLQLCKGKCDLKYCVHKIFNILLLCTFWVVILNVLMHFIIGAPIKLSDVITCYFQKGAYSLFWFFGTTMIIYAVLPLLHKFFASDRFAIGFTAVLAGVCVIIHIASVLYASKNNVFLQSYIIQSFRLWTWFFYFCLGGCIKKFKLNERFSSIKWLVVAVVAFIAISICDEYYLFKVLTDVVNAEYYYDSPFIMLEVSSIFLLLMNIKYSAIAEKIIEFVGANLIGGYIFHMQVIRTLFPHLNSVGFFGEYGLILFVALLSLLISAVINKIPYLNRMLKI